MIPGIDPKVDIVFKKVYGSDSSTNLTISLINAVLESFVLHPVVEVELLNPYSEKMRLDDKLSILDIKARDQAGWLFNVEMQMLIVAMLSPRLLYYWAKVYGQQLAAGDEYSRLRPTISICFINGVLFPDRPAYHTCFRLLDPTGEICLTDNLVIHVIEIPKFHKTLAELETALDFWLYFLKNGEALDADDLPTELDRVEIRQAMEILTMLTQNDLERELYEGRLKVKRDQQTQETLLRMATERSEMLAAQVGEWQQRYEQVNREREAAYREREAAYQETKHALAERIGLCQRLLQRPVSPPDGLLDHSVEQLREQAERLERELTELPGPG